LNYIGLGQMDLDKSDVTAQAKFALASKTWRKKDVQVCVYIARAYMNKINLIIKCYCSFTRAAVNNSQDAQFNLH
jgi:hypothetical protein